MSAVLMTPSPCERRLSVATRAGVPATMRPLHGDHAPLLVAFHDLGEEDMLPWPQPGAPLGALRSGSRHVSRIART